MKKRTKMLALLLGMSMLMTFPKAMVLAAPENGQQEIEMDSAKVETPSETETSSPDDKVVLPGNEDVPVMDDSNTPGPGDKEPVFDEIIGAEGYVDGQKDNGSVSDIELEPGQEKPETVLPPNGSASQTPGTSGSAGMSGSTTQSRPAGATADENIADLEELTADLALMEDSFRFQTVDKEYALAAKKLKIYIAKDETSAAAGKLAKKGLCYILKAEEDWCYVESGKVRGFVKTENLITGDEARTYAFKKKLVNMKMAQELLSSFENPAFTYTKTTVQQTLVNKVPGIAAANELNIREDKSTDARIAGVIPQGGLCYILADRQEEWCYVESGNVRGFVKRELLLTGQEAKDMVEESGAKNMALAEEVLAPKDNTALYYTLTSTKEAGVTQGKYLGKFKITAYCACSICCGSYANGITASGTAPIQGQTIAMYGVPFGTRLMIGGRVYTVEDRGTPYGHVDIYMQNHEDALEFGVKKADVYLAE